MVFDKDYMFLGPAFVLLSVLYFMAFQLILETFRTMIADNINIEFSRYISMYSSSKFE